VEASGLGIFAIAYPPFSLVLCHENGSAYFSLYLHVKTIQAKHRHCSMWQILSLEQVVRKDCPSQSD